MFSPDPVYPGETLTVTCTIQSEYTDWNHTWFRGETSTQVTSSGRRRIDKNTLTISKVQVFDQDDFSCQGERLSRPKTSKHSDKKRFAVLGKKPHDSFYTFSLLNMITIEAMYSMSLRL